MLGLPGPFRLFRLCRRRSLAWHLAGRYLRRRRIAWLALAAVTLTVAVSNVILGVMQGWLETSTRQIRASEADLTAEASSLAVDDDRADRIAGLPGVAGVAPYIEGAAIMNPLGMLQPERFFCTVDGIDWEADTAMGRKRLRDLHPAPIVDLGRNPLPPGARGSAFLTPRGRADRVLRGLELAAGLGVAPLPLPPRFRPRPGIILGRELIYHCGGMRGPLRPGAVVRIVCPNGTGGSVGTVAAEVSDVIGSGVYEIDRYQAVLPLPLAQRLCDLDGKNPTHGGVEMINGWRIALESGADREAIREQVAGLGLWTRTWEARRGHITQSLEVMRNIMVLVTVLVQCISIFIVYAVFSTMVAEKRHDIGALLGIGAPAGAITRAFLLAAGLTCLAGGCLGWALGWGALLVLNPVSEWLGLPLFPQQVIYTPEAPVSYDPVFPLLFIGVSTLVGLLAAFLPAWQAGRIDPVETLRDHG